MYLNKTSQIHSSIDVIHTYMFNCIVVHLIANNKCYIQFPAIHYPTGDLGRRLGLLPDIAMCVHTWLCACVHM